METTTLVSTREAVAVGAVAGSMVAFAALFVFIWWILTVIATWKILKKGGEPGWKSLIPIYNYYMLFKIVGMKAWFWVALCATILLVILMSVDGTSSLLYTTDPAMTTVDLSGHTLTLVSVMIYGIGALIVDIFYSIKTSRAFGHGAGYALGLIFLQPIFWLIIGFGNSKYNKKIAMGK